MRVNVYTEELYPQDPQFEIVTADYVSSRTNQPMTNYGLRIYLKSSDDLHFIPERDDDRSSVTFWCGADRSNITAFLNRIREVVES